MHRNLLLPIAIYCVSIASTSAGLIAEFTHGGHSYHVYGNNGEGNDERNWGSAGVFAASLNVGGESGYLARIDDAVEDAAIFSVLKANDASFSTIAFSGGGIRYVWIGANDRGTEGVWRWSNNNEQFWQGVSNGSPVGGRYSNWGFARGAPREPDDFNGQDGGAIALENWPEGFADGQGLGDAAQWNDISDANVGPFVVEFDAVAEPPTLEGVTLGISQGGDGALEIVASDLIGDAMYVLQRSESLANGDFAVVQSYTGAQLMGGVSGRRGWGRPVLPAGAARVIS